MDDRLSDEIAYWATASREMRASQYDKWVTTVERWVDLYASGNSEFRQAFRTVVNTSLRLSEVIECYADVARKKLNTPEKHEYLKRGIVAISLANCPIDYRDTFSILAGLVAEAEKYQLDPFSALQEISLISNDERSNGGISMKDTFANFHTYAVLADVRRKVRG